MVEQIDTVIKPQANIDFSKYSIKGWDFYHSVKPMFSAKELDIVSDQVGTMSMPEIFYGYNHLYIVRTDKDLLLEFSPIDILKLAAFDSQKIYYKEESKAKDELSK
jgi:hypothetical protein